MKIIAEKARIDDIADAVRQKLNVETQYKLSEIPAAIDNIYVGGELEPLSATANGDYMPGTGIEGFSRVHVAVPGPTLVTKNIVSNGTYNASQDNADGYSSVIVNVPGGVTVEPLEVTQNGTYNPPSGVDGYAPVTVNVSGGGGSVVRVSTKSMGGSNASVDVYVNELFVENVGFMNVSAGAYKDFGIIRVMYNTPASDSPDGVAHTGWCVFALSACTSIGSTYTANQLILEWQYNQSNTCIVYG